MFLIHTKEIKYMTLGKPNSDVLRYCITMLKTHADFQEKRKSIATINIKRELAELHVG